MNEDAARTWIAERWGTAVMDRIGSFLDLVVAENGRQNLISPGTVDAIWSRHAVDSAQLLALAPERWRSWLDIGTGGGFPGMIVALLAPERSVTMVEPRRKRAAFLADCVRALDLPHADVVHGKAETLTRPFDVISARAVSRVENILHAGAACAKTETIWLLPRGRSGDAAPISVAKLSSQMFHVEHSITDAESSILVMQGQPQ
ncbi:16S rRNA (guanine(527)-N(7))-methyltransferase RsmG [Sphingomonas sp.]|uniref:16S rRNA (guanine(527)-N(7))-methyltransferase RsmG n=1 Tax=Sphingomonas sp. TaxID=28214 RepID=UPI0035BC011B